MYKTTSYYRNQPRSKGTQCKDIDAIPILEYLEKLDGEWANWFGPDPNGDWGRSVVPYFPLGTCDKLILAKMNMLIRRDLVSGCGCGCRGDFVITDKGKKFLEQQRCINSYPNTHTSNYDSANEAGTNTRS